MAFFQNSVLEKHLKAQDTKAIKLAYEQFRLYFHNSEIQENIRNSKEEQFQEGFLRELFGKILGYTLNPKPNFNLTTELKNEHGAKKADGAILQNGKALGVIELKGTDTKDLEKINQQAFNYKNNQTSCVYVITSNFEKLRFYIHHSVEHLEFNLFTLTETEFQLLWLCLSAENLFKGIPLKVKEESLLVEENVTKKLYKDYATFRQDLWQNMVKNNVETDKLLLFKKTQKLLDRFLFIFFAEDSGLLPTNSISRIIKRYETLKNEDAYKPLYEIFKQYFSYIDKGRKGQNTDEDIFAYNGGLFTPDEVLDTITIEDDVLYKHVKNLTIYDFASEVDVNILGHIFENSLNEIENITAQLNKGLQPLVQDKQQPLVQEVSQTSKRKKDGVFYTPKYITKYIVENTVGKLCEEKKTEFSIIDEEYAKGRRNRKKETIIKLDENLKAYRNWLLNITICDPACGSGAFLNQALEFLINQHAYIDELQAQLFGGSLVFQDVSNHILENNIFGVDINDESVDIAKLSLWLRTAQKGRKLTSLNNNIKCGNSLIDDKNVAGDKAFNWQTEFPTVFKEKEKKAFHITTATHDSRTSERMIEYNVREKRENGLRPQAQPIWLELEDEILITKTISEIVIEDKLNVLAYNICGDHIHFLLVCEETEVSKIVGKIKGKTSRVFNNNKGINPLVQKGEEKSVSLWTQKFGCNEITDEKQLWNTVEYIQNNRTKHELPSLLDNKGFLNNKGINPLVREIEKMICTFDHAFRTEYNGGFDVVIGNPPYGMIAYPEQEAFLKKNYKTVEGRLELYELFIEKSLNILSNTNSLSFIVPNTFLSNLYSKKLREFITNENSLCEITNFGIDVFSDPTVHTCIIVVKKNSITSNHKVKIRTQVEDINELQNDFNYSVDLNQLINNKNKTLDIFISPKENQIFIKASKMKTLGDLFYLRQCIKTGNDNIYVKKAEFENEPWRKSLRGKGICRYGIVENDLYLKYGNWLARNWNNKSFYETSKIVVRETGNRIISAIDTENRYLLSSLYSVYPKNENFTLDYLKFVLTIINSRFATFYIHKIAFGLTKGAFTKVRTNQLARLPLPQIEDYNVYVEKANLITNKTEELESKINTFLNFIEKSLNIELSKKIEQWYNLKFIDFIKEINKGLLKPLTKLQEIEWMEVFEIKKAEIQELKTQISQTDKEIDRMVYELYGLNEEEIRIVENS